MCATAAMFGLAPLHYLMSLDPFYLLAGFTCNNVPAILVSSLRTDASSSAMDLDVDISMQSAGVVSSAAESSELLFQVPSLPRTSRRMWCMNNNKPTSRVTRHLPTPPRTLLVGGKHSHLDHFQQHHSESSPSPGRYRSHTFGPSLFESSGPFTRTQHTERCSCTRNPLIICHST